jgi:hypothetical protein
MEELSVEEGMLNSLSLITTLGFDLSDSEREDIIKKSYMSSLAVKDFVTGELDLDTFLDIQRHCLTDSSLDDYLDVVENNIQNLSFAELLMS